MRTHVVFAIAHNMAARLGHKVTPVHFLLALLHEGGSPAVVVLYDCGVRLKDLEQDLETQLPPAAASYEPEYLWTADDRSLLQNAAVEASELGHPYQGCEHVLLAALRDPESAAAGVLARHHVRYHTARAAVLHILGSPNRRATDGPSPAA
jgi:ATP-dependent Clp protease ATP-binding subunit ClpC